MRLWVEAWLCLNPRYVWLCLGLGWPRLGGGLPGLWSVWSLVLQLLPCLLLGLHVMSGLQVRWRLRLGPGLGLRLRLGRGPGLGL